MPKYTPSRAVSSRLTKAGYPRSKGWQSAFTSALGKTQDAQYDTWASFPTADQKGLSTSPYRLTAPTKSKGRVAKEKKVEVGQTSRPVKTASGLPGAGGPGGMPGLMPSGMPGGDMQTMSMEMQGQGPSGPYASATTMGGGGVGVGDSISSGMANGGAQGDYGYGGGSQHAVADMYGGGGGGTNGYAADMGYGGGGAMLTPEDVMASMAYPAGMEGPAKGGEEEEALSLEERRARASKKALAKK